MRYSAEHKQQTRERVLKQAAADIRLNGPDRVAVASIMAGAGLTHGGFYAHFASKDDLLVAAIEQMFTEVNAHIDGLMDGRSAADGLARYLDMYLSPEHRDRRDIGCPLPALAADLPRLAPEARQAFELGASRLTGRIAAALAAMGVSNAPMLAASVLSEMVGAVVLSRSVLDGEASAALLRASREALNQRLGI